MLKRTLVAALSVGLLVLGSGVSNLGVLFLKPHW